MTPTLVHRRFHASRDATETFFVQQADHIARACAAMASRFDAGGRLLVIGEQAAASDAHHVAVEFVHPVLVGKRALPALAFTEPAHGGASGWLDRIVSIARPNDIIIGISHAGMSAPIASALAESGRRGVLTFALTGGTGVVTPTNDVNFAFQVPSGDPTVVQEVHETLYHLFWELVHVFLRGPSASIRKETESAAACDGDADAHCALCGDEAVPAVILQLDEHQRNARVVMAGAEHEVAVDLVASARVGDTVMVHQGFAIAAVNATAGESDPMRSLYPFLYEDAPPLSSGVAAFDEVRASTLQKSGDIIRLREDLHAEYADALAECASAMSERFTRGGKLIAFGNGGSATDADDAVADCNWPAFPAWRRLPALSLTASTAVMSAIANDVGFENVFARQIIAFGESGDIALGISTSGNSPSVISGLREAKRRGLLTVAFSGDRGGELASPGVADFCFVARAAHIPRIQEGQATLWHVLLELVQSSAGVETA